MGAAGRWMMALGMILLAGEAAAEDARLDAAASGIADRWWGGLEVTLALGEVVPWRLFTLDAPPRLVVELQGVDWAGAEVAALLQGENAASAQVETGPEGRSRLVLELAAPMAVTEAGWVEGGQLRLVLDAVDQAAFAGSVATADGLLGSGPDSSPTGDDRFVVAIDPGHGGIDPGAERAGLTEADLMLALGLELARALEAAGMETVLTREADVFVPLQERMTLARAGGADVLLSLHADALEEDQARGASVYTLTREAADDASQRMVERHEGGDLIAGLDLAGDGDAVATALMDLARLDTVPRSEALAGALARAIGEAGASVNTRPLRQANLAVLSAADFPSVLIEAGFLSDPGDRQRLATLEGRAPVVQGIVAALRAWAPTPP